MATTTRKGSDNKKTKPRRPMVKTSPPKRAQTNAELRQQLAESLQREEAKDKKLQERDRQLAEALEQQTSTSDILRMIAGSPAELQPVLDEIAGRAAKLCDAEDAAIFRVDGNFLRLATHFGPIPMPDAVGESRVIDRDRPSGRAIADRQTIHVHDLRAAETEFPGAKTHGIAVGVRHGALHTATP